MTRRKRQADRISKNYPKKGWVEYMLKDTQVVNKTKAYIEKMYGKEYAERY